MTETKRPFTHFLKASLVAASALACTAGAGSAAEETIGQREFTRYCAGCHGSAGEGGGPIADYYGITPPPLSRLAAHNSGTFPLDRVYRTIDGRQALAAHGSGDMQVWGERYSREIDDIAIDAPAATQETLRDRLVRGRILELIYYLLTIQES